MFKQNNNDNGGTTIIMTNNTPQPVYGVNQPMGAYSQPMAINQPYQPIYQPLPQPIIQPIQPAYSPQPFTQASYGLGVQGQPPVGPIIY